MNKNSAGAFFFLFIFMSAAVPAFSAEAVGGDLLLAAPHARTAAMNSSFAAVADDANAVLFNPACLTEADGLNIAFTHFSSFADTNYEYISAVYPWGKWAFGGSVMVDYTYNFSWIKDGQDMGSVNNYDFLATAAFGYPVLPNFSVGAAVKFFNSRILAYSRIGFAIDAGMLIKVSENPGVFAGCVLQNVGLQTAYETAADILPVNIKLGAGIKFKAADFCSVLLDLDINRVISESETADIGAGAELCFYKMAYLSAGFGFKHTGDSITLGAGIRPIRQVKVSYAFQPFEILGFTHRISLDLFL
jgi:hypothetical protein